MRLQCVRTDDKKNPSLHTTRSGSPSEMLGDEQSVRTFSTIVANAHAAPNGQNQRYRSGSSGTSLFGTREPIDEAEKARAEAVKAEADKAIRSQASLNEAELQRQVRNHRHADGFAASTERTFEPAWRMHWS